MHECAWNSDINGVVWFLINLPALSLYGFYLWLITPTILSHFSIFVLYWRRSGAHYAVIANPWVSAKATYGERGSNRIHTCAKLHRVTLKKQKKTKKMHTISLRFSTSCMLNCNKNGNMLFQIQAIHQMLLCTLSAIDWFDFLRQSAPTNPSLHDDGSVKLFSMSCTQPTLTYYTRKTLLCQQAMMQYCSN